MKWKPLEKGSIVDIVAPGFALEQKEFQSCVEELARWGVEVRYPKDLFGRHYMFSNNDERRFEILKQALLSPDSDAVWCARAGYGCSRLLPQLARMRKPRRLKPFIGYSDVTSLFGYMINHWNWPVLHAPLIDGLRPGKKKKSHINEFKAVLFGQKSLVETDLKLLNNRKGKVSAAVGGGNLCVVTSNIKTIAEQSARGKIVFFEEVGERGYRIDRNLVQLEQAGFFKGAKAVVFGDFTGGEEPKTKKKLAGKVLQEFADRQNFPVLKGYPAGHGRNQKSVPMNTKGHLVAGKKSRLSIETGAKI